MFRNVTKYKGRSGQCKQDTLVSPEAHVVVIFTDLKLVKHDRSVFAARHRNYFWKLANAFNVLCSV